MNEERLLKVLIGPHITEKATRVADKYKQVVFKVLPNATKPEIKAAVEKLFKVEVKGIQVSNMKPVTRRVGRVTTKTKAWKKAYVSVKNGDIDFTSMQ